MAESGIRTRAWFDKNADAYKAARPSYPEELFAFVSSRAAGHDLAIDCGAGNGQATVRLAPYFKQVVGIDLGKEMLARAAAAENVRYAASGTKALPFQPGSADLVTAAAAAHWFELEKFYGEADRVLKPGGALAVWTYYFPKVDARIDGQVREFFETTLAPYADQSRHWIATQYADLPFPYAAERKIFEYSVEGDFNRFAAVLESSSLARQHARKTSGDGLAPVRESLAALWGPPETPRRLTWENTLIVGQKSRG
jgi:SAM-dependent methyltransferase